MSTKPPKWTLDDEATLVALQARREHFISTARQPVFDAVAQMWPATARTSEQAELVDTFIKHADAIRDALAPFDSGVRAEQPEAE